MKKQITVILLSALILSGCASVLVSALSMHSLSLRLEINTIILGFI